MPQACGPLRMRCRLHRALRRAGASGSRGAGCVAGGGAARGAEERPRARRQRGWRGWRRAPGAR
jgi:hypothetical protein